MHKLKTLLFVNILLASCLNTSDGQADDTRLFIFGHSLLDHRPPAIPTPSNETTVPHWMYLLSNAAGKTLAAGGQYGFLPQHANVPPISQWGYDIVPGVWESDTEPFSDADITDVMITAGNFMQWQPPTEEYPGDPGVTPINATETIMDWVEQQEPNARLYIYENWPDMAGYLSNGFPPNTSDWNQYNEYLNGAFHDWWIVYHNALLASRPDIEIRMIPVGPIISNILTNLLDNSIPITELYEDDAPHGRPSIYFLAALVSYMAIHEELAPIDYTVPTIVHQDIRDNYMAIINLIWTDLNNFNDAQGVSRVFFLSTTSYADNVQVDSDSIQLIPNPNDGQFEINGNLSLYDIDILDSQGSVFQNINTNGISTYTVDLTAVPSGLYFVRILNKNNSKVFVERIIKM